ncbi:hypothetical protein RF11_02425 [Thelohanellus kitauei]|uniref:Uncharacterized protein n=1 Tax=Thelohanellus kitauei TaxID=669202 RepID=A0A0C2MIA3_THEKT|nr:hypothetical protein RF11_02425 [Thelohanellus kitauei]
MEMTSIVAFEGETLLLESTCPKYVASCKKSNIYEYCMSKHYFAVSVIPHLEKSCDHPMKDPEINMSSKTSLSLTVSKIGANKQRTIRLWNYYWEPSFTCLNVLQNIFV